MTKKEIEELIYNNIKQTPIKTEVLLKMKTRMKKLEAVASAAATLNRSYKASGLEFPLAKELLFGKLDESLKAWE